VNLAIAVVGLSFLDLASNKIQLNTGGQFYLAGKLAVHTPLPFVFIDCKSATSCPVYPLIFAFNPLDLI
jgi:hypothetical protein